MENHYERLGVGPAAHPDVIRAAYRALAKLYHPDSGSTPDTERMQQVNAAWETLGDPQRRARYDADLSRAAVADTDSGSTGGPQAPVEDDDSAAPEPRSGNAGWGEAAEPPRPPAAPPQWANQPPPRSTYQPPQPQPRWQPGPPRPPRPWLAPHPTDVAGRRVGAAIVDGILIAFVALFAWLTFVTATYDTVEATDATPECADLRGMFRDCEEIDGTLYVSDATSSLAVQWLTWAVPIVAIHVLLQAATGATVGKFAFGLRTVRADGGRPGLVRTFGRTALAVVDLIPYCFPIVGFLLVVNTSRHQRIGDLAAGTYVVPRAAAGRPLSFPHLQR